MYNFKIVCDNGSISIIRASKRSTAMMLFCKAEGCSVEWFSKHCVMRKVREV